MWSAIWSTLTGWNWSTIAAWLALGLGIGNTVWNFRRETNKPIDERQRVLRDQLRTELKDAKDSARPLIQSLRKGEVPLDTEPPTVLTHVHDRVVAITKDGLQVPDSSHVMKTTTEISYIDIKWAEAQEAQKATNLLVNTSETDSIEHVVRSRHVALNGLLDMLTRFVSQTDQMLEALSRIDNGDRDAVKEWSKPLKFI